MDAEEKQDIIDGVSETFNNTFQTFKDDVFLPHCDTVNKMGERQIKHGETIAANRKAIGTIEEGVKENRGSISRTLVLIITSLVVIVGAILVLALV